MQFRLYKVTGPGEVTVMATQWAGGSEVGA